MIIVVKYPSEIKIGDSILFKPDTFCEVINIMKGTRHSRENGYPYYFTGQLNDTIYNITLYRNIIKYIDLNKTKVKPSLWKDSMTGIVNESKCIKQVKWR